MFSVMDLLDAMILWCSLSRSVELTEWDQILALGPVYPVTLDDLSFGRDLGIGLSLTLLLVFIDAFVISSIRL